MARIVLIDNHDSFVYNLVDALDFAGSDHNKPEVYVYRNTVPVADVLAAEPDLIILSPGPGHPREAGHMMELIERVYGTIPILGICLGFQALLEHAGGSVGPCGPVHGKSVAMTLNDAGIASGLFDGMTTDFDPVEPDTPGRRVPVARYHSLGAVQAPPPLESLAVTDTDIGEVIMAAWAKNEQGGVDAIGLQYHPESILTPHGPTMLDRCVNLLFK